MSCPRITLIILVYKEEWKCSRHFLDEIIDGSFGTLQEVGAVREDYSRYKFLKVSSAK
jgi:hypothetical protein